MSAMHARLGAAIEDDLPRFSGEDFADARMGSVLGAVKRRRAARAAGVSSVSLVGAGALAVGASNVPWGSFALDASPGGSSSVLCTTATPDAVVEAAGPDPVIITMFEGTDTPAESETSPDGVTKSHDADPGQASWSLAFAGDGGEFAKVERIGRELVVALDDGTVQNLQPGADGSYTVTLPSGETYVVTLDPSLNQLEIRSMTAANDVATPSPEPTVTCVTSSPEPSASASNSENPSPTPSSSPAVSAAATAMPNLAWEWDPSAPDSTPFQCGFNFPADQSGTDSLSVSGAHTSHGAIRATFEDWYGGDEAQTMGLGDDSFLAWHALARLNGTARDVSVVDPRSRDASNSPLGFSFVLAKDGVVIATVVPAADGAISGMLQDRNEADAPFEAFLWNKSEAFTDCPGVTGTLVNLQVFAVAGYSDGGDPIYAWANVTK
jgi:hypothetical protein